MKTIYLVRHGESESNIGVVISGGAKTALTERGRQQAAFVARRLSQLPIDVIVTSTYLRAKQSGEIIAQHSNKPIDQSDLFVEWNQGSHRIGKMANDPEMLNQVKMLVEHLHESSQKIGDEENFSDLNERAGDALQYLVDRSEDNIVVIGHGWFTPVLVGKAILGEDFTGRDCQRFMQMLRMQNAGITILTHGDKRWWGPWNLETWNDHAHLADS